MTERNGVLDFWRGFVLLTIFVNHVPGNFLEALTYRNVSFSDSAEAFVFLSGLSLALAYGPRLPQMGFLALVRRCLGRALTLYHVHLTLTLAAVALFGAAFLLTHEAGLADVHGRAVVFEDPAHAFAGILLLGHQLGYFNILPLYVVLMLWAPVALVLARAHAGLALGVSLAIYAGARLLEVAPPSWPEPGGWFLNPFAWQLLFTLGVVAGLAWRTERPAFSPALFGLALAVLAAGVIVVSDGLRLAPGLWEVAYQRLDVWKQDLGLVRLVHFLALAYVLSQVRLGATLSRTAVGGALRRVGRQSLVIFVAGSFLSAVGQAAMTVAAASSAASPEWVGTLYTAAGALGLVVLARCLEWKSSARPAGASPRAAAPRAVLSLSPPSVSPLLASPPLASQLSSA